MCAHLNTLYIQSFNAQMQNINQSYNLLKIAIKIGNISRRKKNKSSSLERCGIPVGSIPSVLTSIAIQHHFLNGIGCEIMFFPLSFSSGKQKI